MGQLVKSLRPTVLERRDKTERLRPKLRIDL